MSDGWGRALRGVSKGRRYTMPATCAAAFAAACLLGGCGNAHPAAAPSPTATPVIATRVSVTLCPAADLDQAAMRCRRAAKSVSTGKLDGYYVVYAALLAPGSGALRIRIHTATPGRGSTIRRVPLGHSVAIPTGSGAFLLSGMFGMTGVKPARGRSYIIEFDGARRRDTVMVTVAS